MDMSLEISKLEERMEELTIPPSPNWYQANILACSTDNTLVYGSRNDLVVITPRRLNIKFPSKVKLIPRAHSQRVISVSVNKAWTTQKHCVSAGEDNVVCLWDIDTLKRKVRHNSHQKQNEKLIGANFAGEDRIVSVAESGRIVIWNIATNSETSINSIFGCKVTVTTLAVCPHATWLVALGMKNGLVTTVDLRKNGKIVHRLRGHDTSIVSLSWCPAPVNVFPKNPKNTVRGRLDVVDPEDETYTDNIIGNSSPEINPPYPVFSTQEYSDSQFSGSIIEGENIPEFSVPTDIKTESPNMSVAVTSSGSSETDFQIVEPLPYPHNEWVVVEKDGSQMNHNKKKHKKRKFRFIKHRDRDSKVEESHAEASNEALVSENNQESGISNPTNGSSKDLEQNVDKSDNSEQNVSNAQTTDQNVSNAGSCEHSVGSAESSEQSTDNVNISKENVDNATCNQNVDDGNISEAVLPTNEANDETFNDKKLSEESKCENFESQTVSQQTPLDGKLDSATITELTNEVDANEEMDLRMEKLKIDDDANKLTDRNDTFGKVFNEQTIDTAGTVQADIVESVEDARKEFLLASSAKDSNIYIWRAGTDGRMQTLLTLPGVKKINKYKIWIALHWMRPNYLLSSSKTGQLLQWTLPRPFRGNDPQVIHDDHNGHLFSIAGPCVLYTDKKWNNYGRNAWTIGQDRLLLNTSLPDRECLAHHPTLGGTVLCMIVSPITPSRVALGMSDGTIRVWELGQTHSGSVEMTMFHQKIQSKVTAMAWHPHKEFLLAYGTMEGRVGIIDTSNPSKQPITLTQYFKTNIYKIEWGVTTLEEDIYPVLYAMADGQLVVFDIDDPKAEPLIVDVPVDAVVYHFAWKPDYTMLLVSLKSGELLVYSSELILEHTIYLNKKGFSNMIWHPYAAMDDTFEDKVSTHWFAATINGDHKVYIYNIQNLINRKNENGVYTPDHALGGHADVITSLAWDYFVGENLVSVAEDGLAQVWAVRKNENIATFIEPNYEGIVSVMWSPLDANYIISAGKNNTINVWNITEHPPQNDEEFFKERKKHIKKQKDESKGSVAVIETKEEEETKSKRKVKNTMLSAFSNCHTDVSKHISDMKRLLEWKQANTNDPTVGLEMLSDSKDPEYLQMFGTREQMINMLTINGEIHQERGKPDLLANIALWKGDIGEHIQKCIQQRSVTAKMVALAPMISTRLWQDACDTYAYQLMGSKNYDPLEAACYFLACHKVEEAISCLCSNRFFREALALAKCRLTSDDPIISDIIKKWATFAHFEGDFETAAECYIFLGSYEQAAKILFKRANETLEVALELANLSGNKDLIEAVRLKYDAFKQQKGENEAEKRVETQLPNRADALLQGIPSTSPSMEKECINESNAVQNGLEVDNINQNESPTTSDGKTECLIGSKTDTASNLASLVINSEESQHEEISHEGSSVSNIDKNT